MFLYFNFCCLLLYFIFFFFNDTATTEIYTLSLHDALPICNDHRNHGLDQAHASILTSARVRGLSIFEVGPYSHEVSPSHCTRQPTGAGLRLPPELGDPAVAGCPTGPSRSSLSCSTGIGSRFRRRRP